MGIEPVTFQKTGWNALPLQELWESCDKRGHTNWGYVPRRP